MECELTAQQKVRMKALELAVIRSNSHPHIKSALCLADFYVHFINGTDGWNVSEKIDLSSGIYMTKEDYQKDREFEKLLKNPGRIMKMTKDALSLRLGTNYL